MEPPRLAPARRGVFVVSDPYDSAVSDFTSRQKSDRGTAVLADLTLLVRPPGQPGAIRAFTDAERADAELYATEAGTAVESLPLESHQR